MKYIVSLGVIVVTLPVIAEEDVAWPADGGSPGGGHYSEAKQIMPANINNLDVAWENRNSKACFTKNTKVSS
jgi:glucose dehydrogenase